jgi:hypothetical protein
MENNINDKQINQNTYNQINLSTNSQAMESFPQTLDPMLSGMWASITTAYALFLRDQKLKVREEGKRMTLLDCANAWKNSDERTKDRYNTLSEEEKKRKTEDEGT